MHPASLKQSKNPLLDAMLWAFNNEGVGHNLELKRHEKASRLFCN
jgi:hypothetical protein